MGFKLPIVTQGTELKLAVSNSKKRWLRTEQDSKANGLSEIAREDTANKIIILLSIHLLITVCCSGLHV